MRGKLGQFAAFSQVAGLAARESGTSRARSGQNRKRLTVSATQAGFEPPSISTLTRTTT
jgi:hypothetical protein